MTILTRYHVQYPFTTAWRNITSRVIGDVNWTEGRNVSLLRGPLPPAVPATLTCTLDNSNGFWTKGAGMAFGPGALFRMQWRATTGGAWTTRYTGQLFEYRPRQTDSLSRITVRFYGALIRFTTAEVREQTYGDSTPDVIMGEMADAVGLADTARDFDTSAETYSITVPSGYAGVIAFADLVQGFVYDTPDNQVRLELQATRDAKAISESFTDTDPLAGEMSIPPPESATNPFGIINQVDGVLRVFTPATDNTGTIFNFRDVYITSEYPAWTQFTTSIPLGFVVSPGIVIPEWEYFTSVLNVPGDPTGELSRWIQDSYPGGQGVRIITYLQGFSEWSIRRLSIVAEGDMLTWSFEHRFRANSTGTPFPDTFGPGPYIRLFDSAVTVRDLFAVLETAEVFMHSATNAESQRKFGVKRRASTLAVSQFEATLVDYSADLGELMMRVDDELARYSSPQRAFILDPPTATNAERDALLARRISDKINLRLAGKSQYDIDVECYIEALQTRMDPLGNVRQRVFVVELPPPPIALAAHADLAFTSGVVFGQTLAAATGGRPPYTYTATGFPAGITFNETTRRVSGTPD